MKSEAEIRDMVKKLEEEIIVLYGRKGNVETKIIRAIAKIEAYKWVLSERK
jgi:hypothetical protein